MTIEWRYTTRQDLGVLSLAGYLGADATDRFTGAIGWALARGTGPVILDLTGLLGWSSRRADRRCPGRPPPRRERAPTRARRDTGGRLPCPGRDLSARPGPLRPRRRACRSRSPRDDQAVDH